MRIHIWRFVLVVCLPLACTTTGNNDDAGVAPMDAGALPDASSAPDAAGTPDAAGPRDAALPPDAAMRPDAAMPPDAAMTEDAAMPPDASMTPDAAVTLDAGTPDAAMPDAGPPLTMVNVAINGNVLLGNNYPSQLHPLFRASFTAGSAMGRLRLFARFCADAACANPLALVPATVQGADVDGFYVYTTANGTGQGLTKDFTIPQAPLGASHLQLVGDTQASHLMGRVPCSTLMDCPGDADVLQADTFAIAVNVDGQRTNPAPGSTPITVQNAGETITLTNTQFLGHIVLDGAALEVPPPADPGHLLVAASNDQNTFRNELFLFGLDNLTLAPQPQSTAVLQKNGADFDGDICGSVKGGNTLYVIGVDNTGANIFRLDATSGAQLSGAPVVTIPPTNPNDPTTFPWPCRGVFGHVGTADHLYLVQFAGAGSLDTSRPSALYHVNLTAGTYDLPGATLGDYALRGVVLDEPHNRLLAVDMSWSVDSVTRTIQENRLVNFPLDANGVPQTPVFSLTGTASNEPCESTANYPSGIALTTLGGTRVLLLGHDTGVAVFSLSTLTEQQNLDLGDYGRLFSQVRPTPDGTQLLALPQCKALSARARFMLPYASGTEVSDTNLVAILADNNGMLALANTSVDVDQDGTADHGVDLDAWHVKSYVRSYDSTLPIPPVVFNAPVMAVGRSMLFVRGTGIQGNGTTVLSSSGLGQAQDVSVHSLTTGRPIIFNGYQPFWDGLSSMAGTGAAIWGLDLHPGVESSVGLLEYLP